MLALPQPRKKWRGEKQQHDQSGDVKRGDPWHSQLENLGCNAHLGKPAGGHFRASALLTKTANPSQHHGEQGGSATEPRTVVVTAATKRGAPRKKDG